MPRLAPLLYAGGGRQIISFVVPASVATGPAEVTILRTDGSTTTGRIVVTDVAPGLWTNNAESRGEVMGQVTQRFTNGKVRTFAATTCGKRSKDGVSDINKPLKTFLARILGEDGFAT